MIRAAALLATAVAALSARADPHDGRVVERIAAVVRSPAGAQVHVITLTRVEEETRVALVSRGGTLAAEAPLDDVALRAGLDWLVDQTLIADEAQRLQILEIDAADVAAELQRFKARFARPSEYEAFLARLELGEDELGAILRRTLRVKRYVESRVGRAADATEAEVAAYARAHAAELPRDPAAARAAARARVESDRVARDVEALVADLRARAEVRIVWDFQRAAVAGGRTP